MADVTTKASERFIAPFNGPIEIGLRALVILNEGFPNFFSIQRLVILDYLIVHSDDVDGPRGLHPQTPRRGGELLVRRGVLQEGLLLYQSRSLVEQKFDQFGVSFSATERSASFVDSIRSNYLAGLRYRAVWLIERFSDVSDEGLQALAHDRLGEWGAEFALESVLWEESPQ